jgi:hypothetical protein
MSGNLKKSKKNNRKNPDRINPFKASNDETPAPLPPYPADNRCQCCQTSAEKRKLNCRAHRLHRGWLCYKCNRMFGRIEKVGSKKVLEFLTRDRRDLVALDEFKSD